METGDTDRRLLVELMRAVVNVFNLLFNLMHVAQKGARVPALRGSGHVGILGVYDLL